MRIRKEVQNGTITSIIAIACQRCGSRAMLGGIHGRQHHEAGIVDDTVGIFQGGAERALQRIAGRMMGDVDGFRRRQRAPRPEPVIEPEPGPQHPGRPLVGMGRDGKAHRAHQMRRDLQPGIALGKRGADSAELPPLQHRQIAMHARRPGGSSWRPAALRRWRCNATS